MRPDHLPSYPARRRRSRLRSAGFTLTEAIVVIVITGIVAAIVALFIQSPVKGYFDATRRAELSDLADTALRRMTRDLRLALPNSVRVTSNGGVSYLEFLITKTGGRYRAELDSGGNGDILEFAAASNPYRFDMIGLAPALAAGSDQVVVYNLGPGFTGADAYAAAGNNRRTVTGVSGNTITVSPAVAFPFESPAQRFHVVESVVTYACSPDAGTPALGTIARHAGYAIQATQPDTAGELAGGSSALLARGVSACLFTYDPNAVNMRNGVVGIAVTLTQSTPTGPESVTLFQQAHVSNVP
jgi:MSHA biogenesis protein MshO